MGREWRQRRGCDRAGQAPGRFVTDALGLPCGRRQRRHCLCATNCKLQHACCRIVECSASSTGDGRLGAGADPAARRVAGDSHGGEPALLAPRQGPFPAGHCPRNFAVCSDQVRRAEQAEPLRLLALLAQPALDLGALRSGQSGGRDRRPSRPVEGQAGRNRRSDGPRRIPRDRRRGKTPLPSCWRGLQAPPVLRARSSAETGPAGETADRARRRCDQDRHM